MKLSNPRINELAKKQFHHQPRVQRIKLMHPNRDWLIGLLLGVALMVGMGSWSAYIYFDQREAISLSNTDIVADAPLYRADLVDQALAEFTKRAEVFNELSRTPVVAPTPETDLVSDESTATTTEEIAPVSTIPEALVPDAEIEVSELEQLPPDELLVQPVSVQ